MKSDSRSGKIGAIAGVVGAVLAAAALAWSVMITEEDTPRLEVDVRTAEDASDLYDFLAEHDDTVVYLSVRCSFLMDGKFNPPDSHCILEDYEEYGETRLIIAGGAHTAAEYWRGGSDDTSLRHRVAWIWFEFQDDERGTHYTQGGEGAGGFQAKGYFALSKTPRGDAPSDVPHFNLRPVDAEEA